MHAVIETTDSEFLQYWNKLHVNDPMQNPIYMQKNADCQSSLENIPHFIDRSFLVLAADEPVFGCSLTLHLDEQGRKCIGYFGREASTHVNSSTMHASSHSFKPEAVRLLQAHVNQLIEEIQPHSVNFLDPVCHGVMSPVTQVLLEKGAQPVVQKAQVIDLSVSQRELYRNMAKSCRGWVEWGRRNLEIDVISGESFESSVLQHAEALSINKDSFSDDRMTYAALIAQGNGFLVQGRYKGELVSSSLFVHTEKTCHHVFMDKLINSPDRPVLHALIWQAMLHGKSKNCNQFDFGSTAIIDANNTVPSKHELAAAGFGGESHARLRVTIER
jgi:hypothetical protein